jgi:5-methylcytosine-specific restriction endonuclease McrA
MKICWDNIEDIKLTKSGNFWDVIKKQTYYYRESCKVCIEPFLTQHKNKGEFCSKKCRSKSKEINNSISKKLSGRKLSKETKKKMSDFRSSGYDVCIPFYDTYATQIEWCEEVRRNEEDKNILEVECTYCGKWYIPSRSDIRHRINSINGESKGEQNLYCSDNCKNLCPIYGKKPETLIREDAIKAGRLSWLELDREVQPELRKMVLERDKYQCVKCGSEGPLHCHHIYPVSTNPLESADVDNCMTLCVDCHKKAHQKDGCKLGQLEVCIEYNS